MRPRRQLPVASVSPAHLPGQPVPALRWLLATSAFRFHLTLESHFSFTQFYIWSTSDRPGSFAGCPPASMLGCAHFPPKSAI